MKIKLVKIFLFHIEYVEEFLFCDDLTNSHFDRVVLQLSEYLQA